MSDQTYKCCHVCKSFPGVCRVPCPAMVVMACYIEESEECQRCQREWDCQQFERKEEER